jgi:hypothetical protein
MSAELFKLKKSHEIPYLTIYYENLMSTSTAQIVLHIKQL